ncbi:hypothetical protein D9611_009520 [Ephemerocybe angulata]|uniref:Uncharacterized protein n=1 Tax=Ephemerocybe angulata TaxID=980116 RepID=A0A8H5ETA0_9AGAR|nr:hypothetical protein D9611_009520 [Tulosesus angulatus]
MLCGLHLSFPLLFKPLQFKRTLKGKKDVQQRPEISAPLPQGPPAAMHRHNFNGRGTMEDDNDSESGVYYLERVPGTGEKQLVKRPRAPLTSPPMDDDFDAYTYTQTVLSRYPEDQTFTANLSRSRSHGNASSSSPPNSKSFLRRGNSNSISNSGPYGAQYNTSSGSSSRRPPTSGERVGLPAENHVSVSHGRSASASASAQQHGFASQDTLGSKGKAKESTGVKEMYGEYHQYMQEMEHMFSKHGDFDISLNRLNESSGARENVTLGRVRSTKSNRVPGGGRSPLGNVGGGVGGLGRNTSGASRGGHGGGTQKKARPPAFEEVSRQVVENTPEKTVTISTWREQVAREAMERTSVYYQGDMQGYARSEMDDIARGSKSSGSGRYGMFDGQELEQRAAKSEGQHSVVEPSFLDKDLEASSRIQGHHKPFPKSPQAQKLVMKPESNHSSSLSSSSTSNQSSGELPPTPPPKPPRLTVKTGDIMQSTPVDSAVPTLPSFHPTKDGSVISTIRSTSSASSVTFEGVLSSCKPPLMHLSPVLEKLGITTVEHLRALGDLNPEIRDRELKDDALRQGVTAMEWAILVDRLRML